MWDYQVPLYEIMDGLDRMVKADKARYIGISNCFAWQLAKANALAEKEGFAKFISIQGHYNLIFWEEEREMAKLCAEDNIAMTPYTSDDLNYNDSSSRSILSSRRQSGRQT